MSRIEDCFKEQLRIEKGEPRISYMTREDQNKLTQILDIYNEHLALRNTIEHDKESIMYITIELLTAPNRKEPTKRDMNKNIEALERAISGKPIAKDFALMESTKSIMEAIRDKLPS